MSQETLQSPGEIIEELKQEEKRLESELAAVRQKLADLSGMEEKAGGGEELEEKTGETIDE